MGQGRGRKLVSENSTPVGSGRSAILPKARGESWAGLVLLHCSQSRGLSGTHLRKNMMGRKSRFLLSEAATRNKLEKNPSLQENPLPAPYSLSFSSVRGTDVPRSQYKYILSFHYSTNMGQAQIDDSVRSFDWQSLRTGHLSTMMTSPQALRS